MDQERKQQIHQLVEASRATDNSDSEAEKTGVIEELLAEVELADRDFERDLLSAVDLGYREDSGIEAGDGD